MLTIVTPNLNNAKYLEDNILSIQKLSIDFEHIVVDGGSTDGSLEIISKYPHVKLLHQTEKTGMYGAIHQGFLSASGEYLTWINSDDRIIIDGFETLYKEVSLEGYDLAYSDGNYFFPKDGHTEFGKGHRFGKFFLRHGCMPAIQPSVIFSKKIYNEVGGLRYDKFKICGDFDLFLRMANKAGSKFKYILVLSVLFTRRDDSLGSLNTNLCLEELKNNNLPTPSLLTRILYRIFKYI